MATNSGCPTALLTIVLLLTVTIAHAGIDDRSPSVARGIIGEVAELACATTGRVSGVSWRRLHDNKIISQDQVVYIVDPRFSVRVNDFEQTNFIDIEDSTREDAGEYVCSVETLDGHITEKTVQLTMIEPSSSLRWRADSKCGDLAECDPLGAYPCCSSGGWCGFTRFHCDCASCIDYRLRPTEPTSTTPASETPDCAPGYIRASTKCLLYSDQPTTWSAAAEYCAKNNGRLITFDTLDELVDVVGNFTKTETGKMVADFPGGRVWVGISTQGRKDSSGTLRWRWVMRHSEVTDTNLLEHLDSIYEERCGYLHTNNAMATIQHTANCQAILLPLCEHL